MAQIHELIGKGMARIGAIGKDSKNTQQGFMYRGIDAVYNALNPVMAELGLFITPEIIDQKREERTTKSGSVITYTILTIKYTVYAPDGSNVQLTVIGEGMDSGDKSSNKAMSVAMKYAMFQLFLIPTEELKDPDADVYTDIQPKKKEQPKAEAKPAPNAEQKPEQTKAPVKQAVKPNPVGDYISNEIKFLQEQTETASYSDMRAIFNSWVRKLTESGKLAPVDWKTATLEQAKAVVEAVKASLFAE